ncbi:MAG: hypothetical protein AAGA05_11215 [Pseudomonadota bacterium]
MTGRSGVVGVTLIEVLAALAVSAMIGVAGFTLLDGVTRQDERLSGRIDRIAARDRAFLLLSRDAATALSAELTDAVGLQLIGHDYVAIWHTDMGGLRRRLDWGDGRVVMQPLLDEPVELSFHPETQRAAVLTLSDAGIRRVIRLPNPFIP